MRAQGLTLATLMICLGALKGCSGLRYVPEGATVCPDRVWMMPAAKAWLRPRLLNEDGTATTESTAYRVWHSQIVLVMERLDICNGNDPDRQSPYAKGDPR